MKKLLYTLLFFSNGMMYSAFGQIPNNSFENWSAVGNCEEADEWSSTNLFDSTGTFCPISRSADHYPATIGNYSMRLENNPALMPSFSAYGIVTSTRLDGSDRPLFAVNGHPNALCGYFKFNCVNHDTMSINIYLSYQGNEIASGHLLVDSTVTAWTPFVLPVSNYTAADSARITVMAANIEGAGVQGNSVLYIDNFSFDSLISGGWNEPIVSSGVQLIPNPATDWTDIHLNNPQNYVSSLSILDKTGRLVRSERVSSSTPCVRVDTSDLEQGTYFVQLITADDRIIVEKLIVTR